MLSFEKSVNRNFFIPDKTSFVGNAGFVVDKQLELSDFQFDGSELDYVRGVSNLKKYVGYECHR